MTKPRRRDARLVAAVTRAAPTGLKVADASMSDIVDALANGQVTATALTNAYLARIEAYDRNGPMLNSVRALNPDALAIAGKRDGTRPSARKRSTLPPLYTSATA